MPVLVFCFFVLSPSPAQGPTISGHDSAAARLHCAEQYGNLLVISALGLQSRRMALRKNARFSIAVSAILAFAMDYVPSVGAWDELPSVFSSGPQDSGILEFWSQDQRMPGLRDPARTAGERVSEDTVNPGKDDPETWGTPEDPVSFFRETNDFAVEDDRSRQSSMMADRAPFRIQSLWVPDRNVDQANATLGASSQMLGVGFPLSISSDAVWIGLLQFSSQQFATSAELPDSKLQFPERLWGLNSGVLHTRTLDNGVEIGGIFQIGSASDQLFSSVHEMTLMTLIFAEIPWGERDAWMASLFYSPTAQTNFPLPGLAYVWRPTPSLVAHLGIPAKLTYQMTESVLLEARYTPLTNVFVQLGKETGMRTTVFSRYEVVNEVFWLQNRRRDDDRFFVFDQRLTSGMSLRLPRGFAIEITGNYLFDRKYFQASSFSDDRTDLVTVASGAGVGATMIWNR